MIPYASNTGTRRNLSALKEAGADSIDGTSATMYSCTLPMLDSGVRQPSLLRPDCNAMQRSAT